MHVRSLTKFVGLSPIFLNQDLKVIRADKVGSRRNKTRVVSFKLSALAILWSTLGHGLISCSKDRSNLN